MSADPFEEARLEVFSRASHELKLVVQAVDSRNRYLYTIRLATLFGSEVDLNDGRFKRFTQDRQRNRVRLLRVYMNGAELEHWYSSILNWMGDHSGGKWSATVTMHELNSATFEFSFNNDTASVAFALIFT